jgi:dTDP-4-dehydrorhamnose reductase
MVSGMTAGPILVTGGTGQLAQALRQAGGDRRLIVVGRPEFDFDRPEALAPLLARLAPSLIVNAAAYTAVDRAETDAEAARRANAEGPGLLARHCAEAGIKLIHVSTDYVFDGAKGAPYVESDAPNPIGVYGASKLAGERAVLASGAQAIVLRTSWVYSAVGRNFVLTMLNAARRTDRLRVVADQIGCPTATADLAAAILAIADRLADGWRPEYGGVFHAAGSGWTSWHGLAEAVFAAAAAHGAPPPVVEPIATADWPTPVRRPADSRLDCTALATVFGLRLPDWRRSIVTTVGDVFGHVSIPSPRRSPV